MKSYIALTLICLILPQQACKADNWHKVKWVVEFAIPKKIEALLEEVRGYVDDALLPLERHL